MAKNQRVTDTINQIVSLADNRNGDGASMSGIEPEILRDRLTTGSAHEFLNDKEKLNDDLSLGGVRGPRALQNAAAYDIETKLRHLKRLLLLVHRVLLYKTSAQAKAIKAEISGLTAVAARHRLGELLAEQSRILPVEPWVKHAVSGHGNLVHFYQQAADPASHGFPGGWCYGVTISWLISLATPGGSIWSSFPTDRVTALMASQRVPAGAVGAMASATLEDVTPRYIGPLTADGFRLVTNDYSNLDPDSLGEHIASGVGPYTLASIKIRGGGKHSIAGWKGRDAIHLLDPNCGEMSFRSKAQLVDFLPKLLRKLRYDLKSALVFKLAR